jgi:serine/threonine protein kinase, bacterial
MPLVSGATAAGFSIVRPLGCGQIGELYLAQHPRLPRRHALEILPTDVSADPEYRERFNRESDLAAALWHPHIVGLYDRGEFEGRLWLSMDYVDGSDAAQLLSDNYPDGMPADEVVEIVSAIADALDYAHDHGLLHRYVKPSNILISQPESDQRRILLTGLGIARRLDDINGLTPTNLTVGTVSYAAPEQLLGDSIDGRADQYALAGTAFHLLTGSPPFVHSNPAVVISKHLNEPPPRPGQVRPELADFDKPVVRALAKSPGDRFPRCQDFAKALEANYRLSNLRDAETTAVVIAPAVAIPRDAETDIESPTEPAAATPFEAEPVGAVDPPDVLPDMGIDDDLVFGEAAVSGAMADDTPVTSRRRRLLQTAGFALTIITVVLVGLVIVLALRSASGFRDTPTSDETPSSLSTIQPTPPAPATAIPPPPVIAPAPEETTRPTSTPPSAATTTISPTHTPSPPEAVTPSITKPPSPPPTTSVAVDNRPAVGMPCGPQQAGTTTVSNVGAPVSCVSTPGGFAWEPPGG